MAAAGLASWVAALGAGKLANNDIWLHIKTGQLILAGGSIPRVDVYSFTAAGRDFLAHEWLAGVIFHLVHESGGVAGLIVANTILFGAVALLLALAGLEAGARPAPLLASLALGLYVAASRAWVRPHVFSWLLAALYLWIWLRWRRTGRDRLWLLMIPAQILWANLHGGGILGLGLLALFALTEILETIARGRPSLPARLRAPAAALLAGLAASLVNPFGWRLLLLPFRLTSMRAYMEDIYEWQPPSHPLYSDTTMMVAWMLLASIFVFALVREAPAEPGPARRGARPLLRWLLPAAPSTVLLAFLALRLAGPAHLTPGRARALLLGLPLILLVHAAVRFRAADLPAHLIGAAFMGLAARHNRSVADAALVISPLLAAAASRRPSSPGRPRARGGTVLAAQGAGLVAAAILLAAFGYPYRFSGSIGERGFGLARETPACAVEFIDREGLHGNAFVAYRYAAMLVHRTHPGIKVNIDSRNDVYGEEIYRAYLSAMSSPSGMDRWLTSRNVDLFLLATRETSPAVGRHLVASGLWAPVHLDSESFVLARRDRADPAFLSRHEYRILRPSVLGETLITASNGAAALAEADRSIAACPESFFGPFYRSKALVALGRFEEARETSRAAIRIDPSNATAWADLGFALAALGDRAGAAGAFRRALELEPGHRVAAENLRRIEER